MFGDTVVLRRVLIPCIGLMRVKCEEEKKASSLKCRASELPFYSERTSSVRDEAAYSEVEKPLSEFEKKTSLIRKEIFSSVQIVTNYIHNVTDNVNMDQVKEWTAYLQEEDNITPRAGAIALGGITGLIFGLRGGMLRKAFYTTVGTLTMTSVCYPKTTATYSHIIIDDTKRYLTIAYNFVYGVKPGDPQKELPSLPSVPTSLSDVWSFTSSIGRSAKTLLLGEKELSTSSESSPKVFITNIKNIGEKNTSNVSCDKSSSDQYLTTCSTDSFSSPLLPKRVELNKKKIKIDVTAKIEE